MNNISVNSYYWLVSYLILIILTAFIMRYSAIKSLGVATNDFSSVTNPRNIYD